jgi:hypothetical protein
LSMSIYPRFGERIIQLDTSPPYSLGSWDAGMLSCLLPLASPTDTFVTKIPFLRLFCAENAIAYLFPLLTFRPKWRYSTQLCWIGHVITLHSMKLLLTCYIICFGQRMEWNDCSAFSDVCIKDMDGDDQQMNFTQSCVWVAALQCKIMYF